MARQLLSKSLIVCLTAVVFAMAVFAQDRSELPLPVGTAVKGGGFVVALWWRDDVELTDILVLAVVIRVTLFALPPSLSDKG